MLFCLRQHINSIKSYLNTKRSKAFTKTGSGQIAGTCVNLYNKAYMFIESVLSALNLLLYLYSKKVL